MNRGSHWSLLFGCVCVLGVWGCQGASNDDASVEDESNLDTFSRANEGPEPDVVLHGGFTLEKPTPGAYSKFILDLSDEFWPEQGSMVQFAGEKEDGTYDEGPFSTFTLKKSPSQTFIRITTGDPWTHSQTTQVFEYRYAPPYNVLEVRKHGTKDFVRYSKVVDNVDRCSSYPLQEDPCAGDQVCYGTHRGTTVGFCWRTEICSSESAPVCGGDRRTHLNACMAKRALIEILHDGPC